MQLKQENEREELKVVEKETPTAGVIMYETKSIRTTTSNIEEVQMWSNLLTNAALQTL
jgi:hypothetical protein